MAKRTANVIGNGGELRKFYDTIFMQLLRRLQEDGLISIDDDFNEEDYHAALDRFSASTADWIEETFTDEQIDQFLEWSRKRAEKEPPEEVIAIQHAPEQYRYPTDKETRLILSGAILPDGEALPVKGTGSYITIFPAENENPSNLPLTTEQYSIMIAIAQATIPREGAAPQGGVWLTPEQIFRLMLADDSVRLKPDTKENIIAAVRFMMNHKAEIMDKKGRIIRANMIFGYEVENTKLENGNPVKLAWFIKEMPVFMMYACQRGQICAIPKPVVALPSGMKYTEKNLAIRDCLLREIEWMKYSRMHPEKKTGKRAGTRILYNSIFNSCQMPELSSIAPDGTKAILSESNRRKATRYKAQIRDFCAHFTSTGEIAGYTTQQDGITVTLP